MLPMQNVRKPSSWIDAAVNVTEHSRLYSALFYNFQGLKWAAQNYSQGSTGGGYSRAGASVRKTTEKVRETCPASVEHMEFKLSPEHPEERIPRP